MASERITAQAIIFFVFVIFSSPYLFNNKLIRKKSTAS